MINDLTSLKSSVRDLMGVKILVGDNINKEHQQGQTTHLVFLDFSGISQLADDLFDYAIAVLH